MFVRFSPHLEAPHPLHLRGTVGEVALGAAGLIGLLETQLGLPPVVPKPGEALFAYRASLAAADDLARFYRASFATDPVGTTRALAHWRSRWYEAGWSGDFPADAPPRLVDMAHVEKHCRGNMPLTRGERLIRIARALERGMRTQISGVELHVDPQTLPAAWRVVLEKLPTTIAPGIWPLPRARVGTDLQRVQQRLKAYAETGLGEGQRETLAGDGSVFRIAAVSRDVSAQAVGEYLHRHEIRDTVVLAERDGIILDNALERVGLPRAGFQHYTQFRGVTQVLKLVLALLWEPLSPDLMLQFLSHPVGPLSRRVRGALAEAVAAQPGIGGRRWNTTLAELAAREPEVERDIAWWLGGERFDPRSGAPTSELAARARRVRAWLTARLATLLTHEGERVLYAAAIAQSDGLETALERLAREGRARIPKVELDLILDEVATDSPDPGAGAEAGHISAASRAGQITEPLATVIWWDPSALPVDVGYPWSVVELAALRANDVALPHADDIVAWRAREWLRPILNASERLLLVVHTREEGAHPVLGQIAGAFSNVPEWHAERALLETGTPPLLAAEPLALAARPLEPRALPARRRWWTLPPDVVVPPREGESYSSLAKLFDYPHGWVLRYAARLRPARAAELASGALLFGNLAHRLMELWFDEHPAASPAADVRAWLAAHIPRLLEQEGATLLVPGAGVERQRVVALLERALERLIQMVNKANVATVRTEVEASASFADTALTGTIDLLLTDPKGSETVVDVKWGGEPWRIDELASNRQLQLATYAYLRREATGQWPQFGFFIVATGNALARGGTPFVDAVRVVPTTDEGVEELWNRMMRTYAWRRAQLAEGRIEVVAADTLPDVTSMPPLDGLAVREEADRYDDYVWLTGFPT